MNANFQWINDGVDMPSLDFDRVEAWICDVAGTHDKIVRDLNYIFCNDAKILEVNLEFLKHDYYTDIITFDNTLGTLIRGDIFISLDTVLSNSRLVNKPYINELYRVIIHGVLHLCGINDKGPGEREVMEANEDEALAMLSEYYL